MLKRAWIDLPQMAKMITEMKQEKKLDRSCLLNAKCSSGWLTATPFWEQGK